MSLIPFDETGALSSNLKTETHTISSVNGVNYYYIIPDWAPFYKTGFTIYHQESSAYLVEGEDFYFTYELESAEDAYVGAVYGGIYLLDNTMTGTFDLSMQSLGGDFVTDTTQAIEDGYSTLEELESVTWSDIATPATFPTTYHTHSVSQADGMTEILNALSEIETAIVGNPTNIQMSDITDLDTEFLEPLLTGMSSLASAMTQNVKPIPAVTYTKYLETDEVDVGTITADTWTDLPLSVTVENAGTYWHTYDVHPLLDDGVTDVLYRWVYDDSTFVRGGLNNVQHAVTEGAVVKLQIMCVGTGSSQCVIADANRSCFIALAYCGQ